MKFIADRMLGKLAKGLRMLGYDTLYYQEEDLHHLIHLARQEARMILTRNTKLFPKRQEDQIFRVKEDHPTFQLKELIRAGYIKLNEEILFSRCLLCNAFLDEIQRGEAEGRVPDFILYQQKEFFQCPQCQRIYWKGSHQGNMQRKIEALFPSYIRERTL